MEGYYFLLKNEEEHDITFKINGKNFHLHRNIIKKSLFFKALLDNEQHMGIKNDEIIINNIYNDLPIDHQYVYGVLNYLYNGDVNAMEKLSALNEGASVYHLVGILQFYIISDFFQIDDLKENMRDNLTKMLEKMLPRIPQKIKEQMYVSLTETVPNGKYVHGEELLDPYNKDKENITHIIKVFYEKFSYFKRHAPNYFSKYVNRNVRWYGYKNFTPNHSFEDANQSVIDSLLCCDPSKFWITTVVTENKKEYDCIADNIGAVTYVNTFITDIYYIYKHLEKNLRESLHWNLSDEEKNIPIELAEIIMSIVDKKDNCIILLDTKDWMKDGLLNWQVISEFEKVCNYYGQQEQFKKKLKTFMDINYV